MPGRPEATEIGWHSRAALHAESRCLSEDRSCRASVRNLSASYSNLVTRFDRCRQLCVYACVRIQGRLCASADGRQEVDSLSEGMSGRRCDVFLPSLAWAEAVLCHGAERRRQALIDNGDVQRHEPSAVRSVA